jgi:15-cis-phytoene synthase
MSDGTAVAELEHCVRELAHAAIARHGKSVSLAAKLLPPEICDQAVVLYAYCRRADDAIDSAPDHELDTRLAGLRRELDAVYAGRQLDDPIAAGFQVLVHARAIPRVYADELLAGLESDALGARYASHRELLHHCYRVSGTVALMMCHVMGVRDDRALLHAAHLGIAMQLTLVCRDVLDDWERGRLYLPCELLAAHDAGWLDSALGSPFPTSAVPAIARAISALLDQADLYYVSGDACAGYLAARCALAVRTARLIHSEIGSAIRKRGCDPRAARKGVPAGIQLLLAARAGASMLGGRTAEVSAAEATVPRTAITDVHSALHVVPTTRH